MRLGIFACVLASWLTLALSFPAGAVESDRLERFHQLAASRLGTLDLSESDAAAEVLQDIYALLDDEILENLKAGSVFASEGFLQERLKAFSEVWGGSAFQLLTLPAGDLTVGGIQLSPGAWGNSIRVYRGKGPQAEFLAAIYRPGVPHLSPMPPTRAGQGQFLAVWVGPLSPWGTPALRIELWRQEKDRVRAVWTTADLFGPDLHVLSHRVRGLEIMIYYETRYPGWKPGCERQTEQADHYRYVPASETFALTRREVLNGWHRELYAAVERLLAALRQDNRRVLSALGVTPELRRTVPDRLERDSVCDIVDGPSAEVVRVSATAPGDPRPWTLTFRRTREGWRLQSAERLP